MPITRGQKTDSAWRHLSVFTALVVFFSGISPVTAHAAVSTQASESLSANLSRSTQRMHKLMENPQFAGCRQLTVVIAAGDQENLKFMVSSGEHIEISSPQEIPEGTNGDVLLAYKLRSILWAPQSVEFRQDYQELRLIESLRFAKCESHNPGSRQ